MRKGPVWAENEEKAYKLIKIPINTHVWEKTQESRAKSQDKSYLKYP